MLLLHGIFREGRKKKQVRGPLVLHTRRLLTDGDHAAADKQEQWVDQSRPVGATTYGYLLQACIEKKDLLEGKRVHAQIIRTSLEKDVYLGNLLVNMYGKCGSLEDARRTFDALEQRNVVTWNALISAHGDHGDCEEALQLFEQMQLEGIMSNMVTFVTTLRACIGLAALEEGRRIHSHIVESGFESDVVVGSVLVNMYGKCGDLKDARRVFDSMGVKNVVTWTSMAAAYCENGHFEEALRLFQHMQLHGENPNKVTFITALHACASLSDVEIGRTVHRQIVEGGLESDVAVGNALVNMYGKVGAVDDACETFNKMFQRDVISWNALIAAYAQNGQGKQAICTFLQMELEGVMPDKATFTGILNATAGSQDADLVQACISDGGFDSDIAVGNALINMYSKNGRLEDADLIFQRLPHPNLISWNAIIAAYVQHEYGNRALLLFRQMQLEGMTADRFTFVAILDVCSLSVGRQIHGWILETELEPDIVLGNATINMYGKCGCPSDARKVFNSMHQHNVISWTSMMGSYVENGYFEETFELFHLMLLQAVLPNAVTFATILAACGGPAGLGKLKVIHDCILETGLESDGVVGNALLSMFSKCGRLDDAYRTFREMQQQNVVSWTSVITAYAEHSCYEEALETFRQMQLDGVKPNQRTFSGVLNACACVMNLEDGKRIHSWIVESSLESDMVVGNALVNMYAKCGNLDAAFRMLKGMDDQRDGVSWNAFIAACVQHGHSRAAILMFHEMQLEGVMGNKITFISVLNACATHATLPVGNLIHGCAVESGLDKDVFVENALVDMHGKLGNLAVARTLFNDMPERDLVSWNAMISAYSQHRCGEEALGLLWKLQQDGERPNYITFVSVLSACSHASRVTEAYGYFASMLVDHGITPVAEHYRSIVDLLGRAGRLAEAEQLIHKMPSEFKATLWMTILSSCRIHGDVQRAKCAAEQVLQVDPQNVVAYNVLSAKTPAGEYTEKQLNFA